ncbi:aminoacyl-tRNA hydrolase [Candidatus Dojkabacteria bacterium]|nr:aminoacyl-tRNA hydrolase [Candidatus Dojkabacteria bacterium]
MKLFVGLGNPGEKYKNTRHNAGFMWVDRLYNILLKTNIYSISPWTHKSKFDADICLVRKENTRSTVEYILVKPTTFMNRSGITVNSLVNMYQLDVPTELILVFDDLDIELGKVKLQQGIGPKTHKGVLSVRSMLGSDYMHVRLGVDSRIGSDRDKISPEDYVLLPFKPDEKEKLDTAIDGSIEQLRSILGF